MLEISRVAHMSLFARSLSVSSLLTAAVLAFSPIASAATPGLVQGANGWYEDIRFFTPDTATVPTRFGVETAPGSGELAFTTVTAGTILGWGDQLASSTSPVSVGFLDVLQSTSAAWQGLGVGPNGLIDPDESLSLVMPPKTEIGLVGMTVFFQGNVTPDIKVLDFDGPWIRLNSGSQALLPGLTTTITPVSNDVQQLQFWFAQPYQTSLLTISGSNSAYHLGAVQIAAVPEPGTVAMAVTGLMVVGWAAARRRKQPA